MHRPTLTTAGAERAQMTLDNYGADSVVDLLADLAEWIDDDDTGIVALPTLAVYAQQRADERRRRPVCPVHTYPGSDAFERCTCEANRPLTVPEAEAMFAATDEARAMRDER